MRTQPTAPDPAAPVDYFRQPEPDAGEQVQQRHRDEHDREIWHHAPEDLVDGDVRRRNALQVEGRHCDRRRQERRLDVEGDEQPEEQRIDVEVLEQRQEDRHEDDDDLGPLERPA